MQTSSRQAEIAGCRVEARASSGKEAIALAKARHPYFVLIDTHLRGDMGSPAVVKKLQTLCIIPVVLVAASDEDVPVIRQKPQSRMGFWSGRLAPGSSGRLLKQRSTGIPGSRISAGSAVVKGIHWPGGAKHCRRCQQLAQFSAREHSAFPQVMPP